MFQIWIVVIRGYSKPKEHYIVYLIKIYKIISSNIVESRDEMFEKCPSDFGLTT